MVLLLIIFRAAFGSPIDLMLGDVNWEEYENHEQESADAETDMVRLQEILSFVTASFLLFGDSKQNFFKCYSEIDAKRMRILKLQCIKRDIFYAEKFYTNSLKM
jgi:hypothetical protein